MALIFKVFDSAHLLENLRLFEKGVKADFGAPPWLNKTFPVDKIMDFVSKDKKRRKSENIEFVLIDEIGSSKTRLVGIEDCRERLEGMKDELRSFTF
jgi:3-dehydroquinate synthetase